MRGGGYGGGMICCGDVDGVGVQMEGEVETMAEPLHSHSVSLGGMGGA